MYNLFDVHPELLFSYSAAFWISILNNLWKKSDLFVTVLLSPIFHSKCEIDEGSMKGGAQYIIEGRSARAGLLWLTTYVFTHSTVWFLTQWTCKRVYLHCFRMFRNLIYMKHPPRLTRMGDTRVSTRIFDDNRKSASVWNLGSRQIADMCHLCRLACICAPVVHFWCTPSLRGGCSVRHCKGPTVLSTGKEFLEHIRYEAVWLIRWWWW
jgi:hypothetical protein